ncbi:glucose-6-phosphate dehydrogenase [archaeon]|jgi:glucose-6-phosphate 1-dehydrogenase|nr:glucose-6-phosphate dehydrogenase [archaeon]MBT6182400.1 glucose-6-phosphate dehydrogenase [archaeon]MBT6606361.1 glucose-6-phosphate dehydrogenase [archaeon]MBT7251470.1 glucose-6-phosphate dehydrogenase [archaeon]MBT7660734.1 glucose-6-phosphate dehydrogenase [archaeon]
MEKEKGVLFVVFGATGNLTKKKLIPGIYNLVKRKGIKKFKILGIARRPSSGHKIAMSGKKHIDGKIDSSAFSNVLANTHYVQMDFSESIDYVKLQQRIQKYESDGFANKVFYLATGSDKFEVISSNLKKIGVTKEKKCWTRVVYEKPFGKNLKSAKKLNACIHKIFDEKQIYRIDHYLGKELVENVLVLRFTNRVLEPVWNKYHVESISVVLDENVGIGERGAYYDSYGAVLDMVQNHMLQLLSLVTMEMPESFSGDFIQNKKAELLKNVRITKTLVGQYKGYTSESGIPKNSKTETFAAHLLKIKNPRWNGVPIYFRTGKFLGKKESKIVINFKPVKCLFDKTCPSNGNSLEIRLFPNPGIELILNSKSPGKQAARNIKMDFCYDCEYGPNTPEGYENLFKDILLGNQTTFTREDELFNSWKIVDKVSRGKLHKYSKKSTGPKALEKFNKNSGVRLA